MKGASTKANGCRRKRPVSATARRASIVRRSAAIKTSATRIYTPFCYLPTRPNYRQVFCRGLATDESPLFLFLFLCLCLYTCVKRNHPIRNTSRRYYILTTSEIEWTAWTFEITTIKGGTRGITSTTPRADAELHSYTHPSARRNARRGSLVGSRAPREA